MLRAAETGDVAALKTAFDDGVDVMAKDAAKNTAVHTNPAFSQSLPRNRSVWPPVTSPAAQRSRAARSETLSSLSPLLVQRCPCMPPLILLRLLPPSRPSPPGSGRGRVDLRVCGVHALACAYLHACADFGPGIIQTHWQHAYVHANIDTNRAASIHSNTRTYIHTYIRTYVHT